MPEITVEDYRLNRNFKGSEIELLTYFKEKYPDPFHYSSIYTSTEKLLTDFVERLSTELPELLDPQKMRVQCIQSVENSDSMRIAFSDDELKSKADSIFLEMKLCLETVKD